MKYTEVIIEQLKTLPHITKETVRQLSEQRGVKPGTVDVSISRFLARKELISLKKGVYVTSAFFEEHKSDVSYTFYIANILRQPSYVSSWTALQYYNLTTEAIREIISVTPKRTRRHTNKAGNFTYHSIKRDLFSNFSLVKGTFHFFIASPSKALFDLLYFKISELRTMRPEQVKTLIEDLRIDIEEMDGEEQAHFWEMINKYIKHYG